MVPSCPLGISRVGPARKSNLFDHIINPLLTKLVGSRWLDIGLVLCFVALIDLNSPLKLANIQPRLLVNNEHVFLKTIEESYCSWNNGECVGAGETLVDNWEATNFKKLRARKIKQIRDFRSNHPENRLRMRQVEHFRSLFQSHFPVRSKSPARARLHSVCSLWFSCSASCCSCFL